MALTVLSCLDSLSATDDADVYGGVMTLAEGGRWCRGKGPRRASLLLAGAGGEKGSKGVLRGRLRGGLLRPTGRRTATMGILAGAQGTDRSGVRDETWGQ